MVGYDGFYSVINSYPISYAVSFILEYCGVIYVSFALDVIH